jgi:CRISPR-associated protein Cas1
MADAECRSYPLHPADPQGPLFVPARMVNEVLYCERLMYLEWVQGEFADNAFTLEGRAVHRRTDRPGPPLRLAATSNADTATGGGQAPQGAEDERPSEEAEERPYVARATWLSSERLGLAAKIDIVEVEGGSVVPIEYKRGKRPEVPEGAYLSERAQLCAQVLLLREHGFHCDEAAIYFAGDRQRVAIEINDGLIETTLRAVRRARELAVNGRLPPPLADSPKCVGCSLSGICLPDEVNLLRRIESPPDGEANRATGQANPASAGEPSLEGTAAEVPAEIRRLHPARDDLVPLYVQEQGAYIRLDGDCLRVCRRDKTEVEARIPNISQLAVFGNVQISTQALRSLLERGVPVSFFTYGGWYLGRAIGLDSKNVQLRLAQYAGVTMPSFCLGLARSFVASKILNCRTLLRRNHRDPDLAVLGQLGRLARRASAAQSISELLGIEGTAARLYFGAFGGMLKETGDRTGEFDFDGRNRRPPRDPVNALLSFCYALLTKDVTVALSAVGLDPLLGFYHQPRFGRPGLALDLMEEFRPLLADSTVLTAINTATIQSDDFVSAAGGVALKPEGRRRLILAYERRMDQLVTHPLFGYRVSYRRLLEVQARLLSRVLLGELAAYPSFRTR